MKRFLMLTSFVKLKSFYCKAYTQGKILYEHQKRRNTREHQKVQNYVSHMKKCFQNLLLLHIRMK